MGLADKSRQWGLLAEPSPLKLKEDKNFTYSNTRCMGAHPLFSALNQRGLNPIKAAYHPSRPDGRFS